MLLNEISTGTILHYGALFVLLVMLTVSCEESLPVREEPVIIQRLYELVCANDLQRFFVDNFIYH